MRSVLCCFLVSTFLVLSHTFVSAQVAIESGQALTGSISPAGEQDTYTFEGTAGDTIVMTMAKTSGYLDPGFYVYDPDANLETSACSSGNYAIREDYKLLSSGTYTVILRDCGTTPETGNYTLAFLEIPGTLNSSADPNGGPIASGETKTGAISPAGDLDAFQVTMHETDTIVMTMAKTSGYLDPGFYLYDPDGNLETNVCSTGNYAVLQTYQPLSSGTYTVVLRDCGSTPETGNYTLAFTKMPGTLNSSADPNGGPIASGETKSGAISPAGDLDAFVFSGCSGDSITMQFTKKSGYLDPGLYLYDPDRAYETSNCSSGEFARLDGHSLLSSGTYTVILRDCGSTPETGNYDLSLVKIPSSSGCCDMDSDGYDSIACPGGGDCDDSAPGSHPGAEDTCDAIDQNCDGTDGIPEICNNGMDDDCDGNTDAADPDCQNGGCTASAAASTLDADPVHGTSDLAKHLTCLLLPIGAVIGLRIWRKKR